MKFALVGGPKTAEHYLTVPNRMPALEFTAVVAETDAAAASAAELLGAPMTGTATADLLEESPDCCDAMVIHERGLEAERSARTAAAAGKHVLLAASPIASSTDAMTALIDVCRDAGVTLMAGHSWRFRPSQTEIKDTVAAGSLGVPGLLRVHLWRSLGCDTEALVARDAVEALDLAIWLFGALPERLYAVGRSGYVQIHCGFPGDAMAVIDCTNAGGEGGGYSSLSLIGSQGAAYADDHHNRNLLFSDGAPRALDPGEASFAEIAQLAEFAAAIGEQRSPAVTGQDGRVALQMTEAVMRSLEQQRPASLKGDRYELD